MQASDQAVYLPFDDYVQSANSIFHFMKKPEYLNSILLRRALVPRYCLEPIDYLNIHSNTHNFSEVAILQKCFCDIPFHKLADTFSVESTGKNYDKLSKEELSELEKSNTHFAYYGEYGVAFSKSWGEQKKLQPVHYLNKNSLYAKDFSKLFELILKSDDLPTEYSQDVINRLVYIKPLRGIMKRRINRHNSNAISVDIYKNFHDEREWRYVPSADVLSCLNIESIIANPAILPYYNEISDGLENKRYKALWLDFSYDDIRYIIVPNISARIDIIRTIMNLPDSCFENEDNITMQKNILISKILVLAEIRKDW